MIIFFSYIGRRLSGSDALEKMTGKDSFLSYLKLPGMLHGKILRSLFPKPRSVRIDTSKTKRFRGVRAVVSAAPYLVFFA